MKILIIDDSFTMRRIEKNILMGIGYEDILEAADPLSAFSLLNEQKEIGLILLDWHMPSMSGLEFLKKIQSDQSLKNIPIIMVTSESDKARILEAIKAGANDYIVKPFTAAVIKEKIKEITELNK